MMETFAAVAVALAMWLSHESISSDSLQKVNKPAIINASSGNQDSTKIFTVWKNRIAYAGTHLKIMILKKLFALRYKIN